MENLEILIKNSQKGNRRAQNKLYERLAPAMYGVCLRYGKNDQQAQDILQEGFIKVFTRISDFRFNGSFEGWVRRIMVNTALEFFRKSPLWIPMEELPLQADYGEEPELETIPMDILLKTIRELPDRYRMVFNLYVLEGYTHNEISQIMGISPGTSKSNLARARMLLQKRLEKPLAQFSTIYSSGYGG